MRTDKTSRALSILIAATLSFGMFSTPAHSNCSDDYLWCASKGIVQAMQRRLVEEGAFHGAIDGNYGKTQKALAAYLAAKNVKFRDYLTEDVAKALWGDNFDYANANEEERLKFLTKIGAVEKPAAKPGKTPVYDLSASQPPQAKQPAAKPRAKK
jgi:hypothetical protein